MSVPDTVSAPADGRRLDRMAFGHLTIAFDDRVLRPRPWTLAQSTWAGELLESAPAGDVLELCAGAGHIGLAAVDERRRLVSVDIEPAAAELTRLNAEAAGVAARVETRTGDMTEVVRPDERFALVVADPPYIPRADTGRFPEDPLLAIDGGDDGLDVVRTCLEVVGGVLLPGGSAVLQLAHAAQADEVAHLVPADLVASDRRVVTGHGALLRVVRR